MLIALAASSGAALQQPAARPSPSLQPADVVQLSCEALQVGDMRLAFKLASPRRRRLFGTPDHLERTLAATPSLQPLLDSSSYEIVSALAITSRRWQCRVRVDAFDRGGVNAVRSTEYRWDLTEQAEDGSLFDLGQCIRHKKHNYRGVVVGWDDVCKQPEEWCRAMNVDALSGGRSQPFYHVLVDRRDRPGAQTTYVAQQNILPQPPEPVDHPSFSQPLFTGELDEAAGTWVPNPLLRAQYPCGLEGCWLVDAVVPDPPLEQGGGAEGLREY